MKYRRDINGTDVRVGSEVNFWVGSLFGDSEKGLFWEIRMDGERWQNVSTEERVGRCERRVLKR